MAKQLQTTKKPTSEEYTKAMGKSYGLKDHNFSLIGYNKVRGPLLITTNLSRGFNYMYSYIQIHKLIDDFFYVLFLTVEIYLIAIT